MENRREEFLKTVCQIYMAAVLVVLPLYYIPGNGYYKLGDSKYYLYRNISLICMGICLAVQIIAVVRSCRMENSSSSGMYMRKTGGKIIRWCREHSVVTAVCLGRRTGMVHGRCHHLPDGRRISDGSGLQRTMHPDFISGRSSVCHSGTHRITPKTGL